MPIIVEIPAPLRLHSSGRPVVTIAGHYESVRDVLGALKHEYPGVVDRVLNEQGEIREHVNVFVDNENSRDISGLSTPVPDAATVTILAAISGG